MSTVTKLTQNQVLTHSITDVQLFNCQLFHYCCYPTNCLTKGSTVGRMSTVNRGGRARCQRWVLRWGRVFGDVLRWWLVVLAVVAVSDPYPGPVARVLAGSPVGGLMTCGTRALVSGRSLLGAPRGAGNTSATEMNARPRERWVEDYQWWCGRGWRFIWWMRLIKIDLWMLSGINIVNI